MIKSLEIEAVKTNPISGKRTSTRKIGNCTFIVSSTFKEGNQKDIVSTIARLIQSENATKPGA